MAKKYVHCLIAAILRGLTSNESHWINRRTTASINIRAMGRSSAHGVAPLADVVQSSALVIGGDVQTKNRLQLYRITACSIYFALASVIDLQRPTLAILATDELILLWNICALKLRSVPFVAFANFTAEREDSNQHGLRQTTGITEV